MSHCSRNAFDLHAVMGHSDEDTSSLSFLQVGEAIKLLPEKKTAETIGATVQIIVLGECLG